MTIAVLPSRGIAGTARNLPMRGARRRYGRPDLHRARARARPGGSSGRARTARPASPRARARSAVAVGARRDEDVRGEHRESRSSASRRAGRAPRGPPARRRSPGRPRPGRCRRATPRGRCASTRGCSPYARPEHQRGDEQACDRVDAVPAGEERRPGRRSAVPTNASQVGGHVQERAAHVQALAARAREQPGRDQVDGDRRQRDDQHDRRPGRRPAKPAGESPRRRSRCPRARAAGRSPAPRGSPAGGSRTSSAPAPAGRRAWRRRPRSRARATSETRCPASASRASEPARMPGDDLDDHQCRDQRQSADQELPIALQAVVVVVRVHPGQANSAARTRVYTAQMSRRTTRSGRPRSQRPRSNARLNDQWRALRRVGNVRRRPLRARRLPLAVAGRRTSRSAGRSSPPRSPSSRSAACST